MIRRLGLVLVVASLVVLFLQNRSPILALHFLGIQTLALPLAIWVVGAVVVGLLTGWLVTGLLQTALLFSHRHLRAKVRSLQDDVTRYSGLEGNWSEEDTEDGDEDLEFDGAPSSRTYEAPQVPRSSLQEGSRYSFSYDERSSTVAAETKTRSQNANPLDNLLDQLGREPRAQNESRAQSEPRPSEPRQSEPRPKTVDAEYRVLIPPPPESGVASARPPVQEEEEEYEDDWDEREPLDEDWDFDDRRSTDRRDRW